MQVITIEFLIFLPLVALVYYLIPGKIRYIWLLVASYFFYMSASPVCALFLVTSTMTTYAAGLLLQKKRRKSVLVCCLLINLGILGVFKYADFACGTAAGILSVFHVQMTDPGIKLLLPVGISFYMFQALGYVIDVYRGDITAEVNPFRYALFVSFFPEVMSGPIERAGHMLPQFREPAAFDPDHVRDGLLRMMWGYFLKMVLADRIAILVNTVYADPEKYPGTVLLVATILYTFQIYCDFAGYTNIAVGAAGVMGIQVMENFDCPYLAGSIADFWRRWHISLSGWFRDYLYFPLGGNRKGLVRKYINIMIVFMVSGLWHGADWTFVLWGGLHGLYQIIGKLLMPVRNFMVKAFHVNRNSFSHRLLKILCTFSLVSFAWIFFRAEDINTALYVAGHLWHFQPWVLTDGTLYGLGLDAAGFNLMLGCLAVLIAADLCHFHGLKISEKITAQGIWLRWLIYIAAVMFILVCGIWGPGYDETGFIYYQF
ncbi:MAG: MBOAT family protein [Butyrivibrio sp.]|jgi:D-alanyl-lipoteichoic acid acyltransferase DltB (MBOAT superfamily)|nr:MBOAT family protein [Butyrivibrio sp.]